MIIAWRLIKNGETVEIFGTGHGISLDDAIYMCGQDPHEEETEYELEQLSDEEAEMWAKGLL